MLIMIYLLHLLLQFRETPVKVRINGEILLIVVTDAARQENGQLKGFL